MAYALIAAAALGVLALLLTPLFKRYLAARGDRVVVCPENEESVAVRVDAAHAALSAAGSPGHFRLESCSRWPEHAACGQQCLAQIEAQPLNCLVRTQVAEWYTDRTCSLCHKELGHLDWTRHKPALRSPQGITMEWADVKPESLPTVLATYEPVCWDCHIAESFRRKLPALVIDNPHGSRPVEPGA
jgi:hypothetical protein